MPIMLLKGKLNAHIQGLVCVAVHAFPVNYPVHQSVWETVLAQTASTAIAFPGSPKLPCFAGIPIKTTVLLMAIPPRKPISPTLYGVVGRFG